MALKQQSSMEFIITYSWAFIIISLFIVSVIVLSDTRPPSFYLASSCNIQPLLPCEESLLAYNAVTPMTYYVVFSNELGSVVYFPPNAITVTTTGLVGGGTTQSPGNCVPSFASDGATVLCTASIGGSSKPKAGTQTTATFDLVYNICTSGVKSSCSPGNYISTGTSSQSVAPAGVNLDNLTLITQPATATVIVNGVTFYNGISTYLPSGNYVLYSGVPQGYNTITWSIVSPSSLISNTVTTNMILTLSSNAVVTASFS